MEPIKLTLNMGKSSITLTLTWETQCIWYNLENYLNSGNFPNSDNHPTQIQEVTPPIIGHYFDFDMGDPMYTV